MLNYINRQFMFETDDDKTHICKKLQERDNDNIQIVYTKTKMMNGWYFIDTSINLPPIGAGYGTAIYFCPYCGVELK